MRQYTAAYHAVSLTQLLPREALRVTGPERQPSHRTISTGTVQWVRTSWAWLPSNRRDMPRRPWDAITIKSHPLSLAIASQASVSKTRSVKTVKRPRAAAGPLAAAFGRVT